MRGNHTRGRRLSWLQAKTRQRLLALIGGLEHGHLRFEDDSGVLEFGTPGAEPGAAVRILDPRFYPLIGLRGSVGVAEAYMDGYWRTDDLTAVIQLFIRNRKLFESVDSGWVRLAAPLLRLYHAAHRNSRGGSRRNIAAHYDLGNDFFRLFLDPTLMYSCALFADPSSSLEEASETKIEHICRRLQLAPEDRVVEIGTGWGGFAIHAAGTYGCHVTTTTISKEQHECALERVHEAGLQERIDVVLTDYRDLRGQFDKLVSIEMIEAVGSLFLETYFRKCHELLRPGGRALIQAITTTADAERQAGRSPDFIKRYIFPGSHIPSMRRITELSERAGLELGHLEEITAHYPRTLRRWRRRFLENADEVRRQGFDDRFVRMWQFYFCYCEAGFLEGHIGDFQILLGRARRQPDTEAATHGPPLAVH